jgi:hypothetical protein
MKLLKQLSTTKPLSPFGFNQLKDFNLAGTGKLGRFNSDVDINTFEYQRRPPREPFVSDHLNFLYKSGYKHLICLDEKDTDIIQTTWKAFQNTTFTIFEITESTPQETMFNQFKSFCKQVDTKTATNKVCVFCFAGLGRTGTFLGAYVLHNIINTKPILKNKHDTVETAINFVRKNYRQEAIEWDWQITLLQNWLNELIPS